MTSYPVFLLSESATELVNLFHLGKKVTSGNVQVDALVKGITFYQTYMGLSILVMCNS